MKTSLQVINELYYKPYIISKDRGNRGYYILTKGYRYNKYEYISKKQIISYIIYGSRYRYNEIVDRYKISRKHKLIILKIMEE